MAAITPFKKSLLEGDYEADDLLQAYQIYAEFNGLFGYDNPFQEQPNIVGQVLEEKYPEI